MLYNAGFCLGLPLGQANLGVCVGSGLATAGSYIRTGVQGLRIPERDPAHRLARCHHHAARSAFLDARTQDGLWAFMLLLSTFFRFIVGASL